MSTVPTTLATIVGSAAAASTSTVTLTYPGGAQAGDLALIVYCHIFGDGTPTTPSGYSLLNSKTNSSTNTEYYLYTRTLTGGEGASESFTVLSNVGAGAMVVFRNWDYLSAESSSTSTASTISWSSTQIDDKLQDNELLWGFCVVDETQSLTISSSTLVTGATQLNSTVQASNTDLISLGHYTGTADDYTSSSSITVNGGSSRKYKVSYAIYSVDAHPLGATDISSLSSVGTPGTGGSRRIMMIFAE